MQLISPKRYFLKYFSNDCFMGSHKNTMLRVKEAKLQILVVNM